MGKLFLPILLVTFLACWSVTLVRAEDAYTYFTWVITYGTASPLGVPKQVILINGQFPGPRLDFVTNDNVIVNVFNKLDEPFLITWNGIKQRKNSWQDGVLGTNCPIPPNGNYTYKFQTKDQIGGYTYFPSTALHRSAGAFGTLNVWQRSVISIPYPKPDGDFSLLIGDWYKQSHKVLQRILDSGKNLPLPNGVLINGQANPTFTGVKGKTYLFRISNVGLKTSLNFRIQGHKLKVVEVEGSHVMQNIYTSLDVHVGQSISFLVTLDQPSRDYYIVASTRFTRRIRLATGVLHYSDSHFPVSGPVPPAPNSTLWSILQARSFRWNLTANAARPNPQGSYHYGRIPVTKTIVLANSQTVINGKLRYAVNGVSHINPDTPLKLADNFNIPGVFGLNSIQSFPPGSNTAYQAASVIPTSLHDFIEVVFQNNERSLQSWHLDGYDFWVVGHGSRQWTPASRAKYNRVDALTRHTVQVYPRSWTSILVSLDNQGMWNLRSATWERQYLGQQLYIRVYNPIKSHANEYDIPSNALLCGKAVGMHP